MEGRLPPASPEAEQSVLGCMLISDSAVAAVCSRLVSDDFYTPAHKEIFAAILEMYAQSQPVDLVTVTEKLRSRGSLDGVGGPAYLVDLSQMVPGAANIDAYIKLVSDKTTLRRLIAAGEHIVHESYSPANDVEEVLETAEQSIFNISQRKMLRAFASLKEELIPAHEQIEKAFINKNRITGIPTGFVQLDDMTSGFHGSELILVAARPSMGKTSFVMNIVQNAAIKHSAKVAVFSLEMSTQQLVNRMICAEAMVDLQKVRTGDLNNEDWGKILSAMSVLGQAEVYIDDTSGISVMEVRSKCRRLKMERGLDMVVIDYLQLMSGTRQNDSRQQQISDISRGLKGLARELDVPVIALSQLSREAERREDKHPMLSDLRDSGAIEQDADIVMMLYRESYYDKTKDDNMIDVDIAKQRNGPTGIIQLLWQGRYTRFLNPAKSWQETQNG
ncbi:MAG: replicative DNA helicase [Christensenellales bacterium]|jgi:replicative DNA helicase